MNYSSLINRTSLSGSKCKSESEAQVSRASNIIKAFYQSAQRPVILSSFGKESLAMIGLAQEVGLEVDVAYFELGISPEKHAFAKGAISKLGLRVEYLKPHRTLAMRGA